MVDSLLGSYSCLPFCPHNHYKCSTSTTTRHYRKSLSSSPSFMASAHPSLLVFSGGTAFNGVVEELKKLTTQVAHVLPVSDDGGSTAEIVRVLGGPAVGDIRSRCLRLSDQSTAEALAVRRLLGHRLPLQAKEAKSEWYDIVEGEHPLWEGVSIPYRETIRSFLVYFQNQILMRPDEKFRFSNGRNIEKFCPQVSSTILHPLDAVGNVKAYIYWDIGSKGNARKEPTIEFYVDILRKVVDNIGNFFFAGARIFFQSLDAAIFLFSRVSDIPKESLVLPVISTNDRLTLGCELVDGSTIRGQNEISHPTNGSMDPINKSSTSAKALPSRIKRVFYMSSEGCNLLHEVFPTPHPVVLDQLHSVDCIVYAMGSLFTSICPSLVLKGIGEAISSRSCPKILLLNGTHDRETSGFSASCFVTAITDALNRTPGSSNNCLNNPPSKYINTILVPRDGGIPVDLSALRDQGINNVVTVGSLHDPKVGITFVPKSLIHTLSDLLREPNVTGHNVDHVVQRVILTGEV